MNMENRIGPMVNKYVTNFSHCTLSPEFPVYHRPPGILIVFFCVWGNVVTRLVNQMQ